jgi:hypothetical protein
MIDESFAELAAADRARAVPGQAQTNHDRRRQS